MIDELATTKQTALELINLSDKTAENMQTWRDVLDQNPDSLTATFSAGFITKPSASAGLELVIDVQTPPDTGAVLRTWAIETKTGDDQKEYFNNIQLTFNVDNHKAHDLVAKGKAIARDDIRLLLQDPTSQLANITVSNESAGDGTKQTHGERYDFTATELSQDPRSITSVNQALQTVLQKLKQSPASS
jgi:hypothetical protein